MGRPAPWACLALLALHLLVTETDRLFYDMGTVTVAAGQSVNDRAGGATAQLRPIVQPRRHRTRRRRLREEARPEARPEERRPEDARPLDIEPPPAPLAGQDGSVELPEARDPGPPGGEATTQKDQPGPRRTRAHPP